MVLSNHHGNYWRQGWAGRKHDHDSLTALLVVILNLTSELQCVVDRMTNRKLLPFSVDALLSGPTLTGIILLLIVFRLNNYLNILHCKF